MIMGPLLMSAARECHSDCARLLIAANAELVSQDDFDRTALMLAACNDKKEGNTSEDYYWLLYLMNKALIDSLRRGTVQGLGRLRRSKFFRTRRRNVVEYLDRVFKFIELFNGYFTHHFYYN